MFIESRIWLPNLPLEVLSHVALPGSSDLQTENSENLQSLPIASNRFQSSNHFENQTSQKCHPLTKENTNTKDTMSKIVTMNSEVEGRKMY